jgi:hypothetical protein
MVETKTLSREAIVEMTVGFILANLTIGEEPVTEEELTRFKTNVGRVFNIEHDNAESFEYSNLLADIMPVAVMFVDCADNEDEIALENRLVKYLFK